MVDFDKNRLMPLEEQLEKQSSGKRYSLGIPAEQSEFENRIALTPHAVGELAEKGHDVLVQAGAGNKAGFSDKEYSDEGAQIVYSAAEVFQCDIILKIDAPIAEERDMMRGRQILISSMQPGMADKEYFNSLIQKKITALSFEKIRDRSDSYPVIRSMSEIVGSSIMITAAQLLSDCEHGKGKVLGGFPGISPAEVVIIGGGTVGEYAARTAMGLGAQVKVFDRNLYKLRKIQTRLHRRIFTSTMQPWELRKAFQTADVLIGAMYSREGQRSCFISEEYLREMEEGSVVMDVSIDQGGCFESSRPTNHKNPVFYKYGLAHYCVPNIASRVPRTASVALSNFFTPVLAKIGDEGGLDQVLKRDAGLRNGIYFYKGVCTSKYLSDSFLLSFKDIDLLLALYR